MQKVTQEYAKSMKSLLRNRGYILVTFGLINQEAQANATIDGEDFAYFSRKDTIFANTEEENYKDYATLEKDWTRVDGTMLFPPRETPNSVYYDTGLISKNIVDEPYELAIKLNIIPVELKGLTINFGENYPVDFDIVTQNGTVEIRGNDKGDFRTEEVLPKTSEIKLVIYTMKTPGTRFRVHSLMFGYGLVYRNDSIINSELVSYVSPIGEDVPQIDFTLTLKNFDKYFNVDNPKSALNFFETGQHMQISYGYELPDGSIEWLKGNSLLCSTWEANDQTATIRCVDSFRNLEGEYYKGTLVSSPKSFYNLAEEVFEDAGVENYYIDPYLKTLYTVNPIPRVTHREALQIVANACRCTLMQDRLGVPQIVSNFIPEKEISCNGQTPYSKLENILDPKDKVEYGSLAFDYTKADSSMYFLDDELQGGLETGYVSEAMSDEEGLFETNPVITITQEIAYKWYGLRVLFGATTPKELTIRTYKDGQMISEFFESGFARDSYFSDDFGVFDKIEIEFTKAEPHNRVVVNYLSFGDVTNFTMQRHDMTSSPTAVKQELVKDVVVPVYRYQRSTEAVSSLMSQDIEVISGETITFFPGDASYNYSLLIDDTTGGGSIVSSGTYYVSVRFTVSGKHKVQINGNRYVVSEQNMTLKLNDRGKTIKWENPLISDSEMGTDLCEWLGDYFKSDIEYEYNSRGNPEMDANDVIHQENDFINDMLVRVYRQTLRFNGAFGGSIAARRITDVA